jgi:translation initiation factor IF-3
MTNYRRKKRPAKPAEKTFVVNDRIPHPIVRLIDEEGKMHGIFPIEKAMEIANDLDKDLVVINPKSEPPVVKLIEFTKFKYQMQKAENNNKSKASETKILMVSVRISDNDMLVRAKKADKILQDGMKVKLQVRMRGREKAHPEVAEEMIKKFIGFVTVEYLFESNIQAEGDSYATVLKSKK